MNRNPKIPRSTPVCSLLALLLAWSLGSPAVRAQSAPVPVAPPPGQAQAVATPTAGVSADKIVQLSPFEVAADKSNTYNALNSNSLTRFNTELDKLPVTADIYDQQFMTDVNATSVEDMISSFTAGAGFASSSSSPDGAAATQQPLDRNGSPSLSLRGLSATSVERDGYFPPASSGTLYTTTFDLERVEVILGPQSLLYGVGGGGGVINEVSKQARFGMPTFASLKFQADQYGNKTGILDFGVGNDKVAVRVAAINSDVGGRRVNIGGPLLGDYVQVAVKPVASTTIRMQYERTTWNRMSNDQLTLTAASTSNDARNGQYLHYLLATNQIVAAANGGASGAGVIDNGHLNWDNVDSFGGSSAGEYTKSEFGMGQIDTVWSPWLSTEIAGGYDDKRDEKIGNSATGFYAPNVTANPTGNWAAGQTSSTPFVDLLEPSRTKDLRVSAVLTNELFGAKSQTVVGGDFSRVDSATISIDYVLADSNFNPVNNGTATHNGLTFMPAVYWSVANGPVEFPILPSRAARITYLGNNYTRAIANAPNAALISPNNPEGLTGNGDGDFRIAKQIEKGVYAANFTDWMDGKLTTLVGFRASSIFAEQFNDNGSTALPSVGTPSSASGVSFNAGANYALLSWLRPYVEVSDSFNPPQQEQADPYGIYPAVSHALGEEVGLKATNPAGTWSGSVAIFHAYSKNEQFSFSSTLLSDINPSGLNGRYGGAASEWVSVDRESEGADVIVTANPIPNLRMRLSMSYNIGTIGTAKSYAQLYNDSFHENSAGDVTYADGTVVYVPATYNSKQLTVASTTAGAIPLTVLAMSTPGNAYYANPVATSGQILSSSNAAKVLEVVDPVHGAILTGQTGLPISAIQINPGAVLPGVIPITAVGDITSGFPRVALNYTTVYTLRSGFLKGLELGGTFNAAWKRAEYYYYPQGITVNPNYRVMYYAPMEAFFNGIFGYERKIGRIDFLTQLNVGNIFNHYHVFTLPSYVNGWAGPDNATFDVEPRSYTWSTTLRF